MTTLSDYDREIKFLQSKSYKVCTFLFYGGILSVACFLLIIVMFAILTVLSGSFCGLLEYNGTLTIVSMMILSIVVGFKMIYILACSPQAIQRQVMEEQKRKDEYIDDIRKIINMDNKITDRIKELK